MPDWYPIVRAARYLGVPPWELAERPAVWTSWALAAERAENEAQEAAQKQAEAQARMR